MRSNRDGVRTSSHTEYRAYRIAYEAKSLIGRVKFVRIFAKSVEIAKAKDWKVEKQGTFWVAKGKSTKGKSKLTRGQKVLDYHAMQKLSETGEQFRVINYIKDKKLRAQFGELAQLIDKVAIPANNELYGFTHGKSVQTLMSKYRFKNTALELDLKDAFHQMSRADIYYLFHITLDLNVKLAKWLTDWASINGKAAMGCPFVPVLFNLWLLPRIHSFNETFSKVKLTSYADDLTIFADEKKLDWKEKALYMRFLKRKGLKFNNRKTRWQHANAGIEKLGLTIYNGKLYVNNWRRILWRMRKAPNSRVLTGLFLWGISEGNRTSEQNANNAKRAFQAKIKLKYPNE